LFFFIATVPTTQLPDGRAYADSTPGAAYREEVAGPPENPLIGTPYLQLGEHGEKNSAKIDIVWHALPDTSAWSVEFKEKAEGSWRKATKAKFRLVDIQGVSAHRIYNDTISHLKAGDPFDYRLLRL
jgi:hypothetical protein